MGMVSKALRALALFPVLIAAAPIDGVAQPPEREPFAIAFDDEGTAITLTGDIMFPPAGQAIRAAVLLVPGTGHFDRDGLFGVSGGPEDLIYLSLAKALAAEGYAVIRADKRGIACSPGLATASAAIRAASTVYKGPDGPPCILPAQVATVDADSAAEDVGRLLGHAAGHPRLRNACRVILAHSEGMLNAAKAIDLGIAAPDVLIGIGAPMDSPAATFRWQRIDRIPEAMRSFDTNRDGVTTNEEVTVGFAKSRVAVFNDVNLFQSPTGAFTREQVDAVRDAWSAIYEQERTAALNADPKALFPTAEQAMATQGWWRQWFTDERPIAARLAAFKGPIGLVYAELDSQVPPDRHLAATDTHLSGRFVAETLSDVGHSLGRHPSYGPMAPEGLQAVRGMLARLTDQACPREGGRREGSAR